MGGARNFRAHFGQPGGRAGAGQGQGEAQGGVFQSLMQFLPIVMLILMSFSSFGGNTQQQVRKEKLIEWNDIGTYGKDDNY